MACDIFNQLRSENKFCDAVITADGVEFHAHKIILFGCNAYFRALFNNYPPDQHTYSIPGVSAHIMELIIEHVYGCQVTITEGNVRELLIAADYLEVTDLVNKCCEVLKAEVSPKTCISIWRLAHLYSLENLKQHAFQMILFAFEEVVLISEKFLDLTGEQLSEIIKNDNLNVKSENVVFDAILKWTSHALAERQEQIGTLVSMVRMGLLTRDYLRIKVMKNALVIKDEASRTIINNVLLNKCLGCHLTRPRLPDAILLAIGAVEYDINVIKAYNPKTDRWIHQHFKQSIPGFHRVVFLNNCLYFIHKYGDDLRTNMIRFDLITRTWTRVSPTNCYRIYAAVCVLDGLLYTMGGRTGSTYLNTVERYNPETDQWSVIAPMQQQRSKASAAALNGKVYVCGGSLRRAVCLSAVEYYNPQTCQWTSIPNMSTPRSEAGVTAYRGELYVVGGKESVLSLRSAEVYNPETNSWRNIPDMITQRTHFGIGVMDDRLFVIGVRNSYEDIMNVEYYDHKTSKWCAVKNMPTFRFGVNYCVVSGLPNMAEYITPPDAPHAPKDPAEKGNANYF